MSGDQKDLFERVDPPRVGNGRRRQALILPKYLRGAAAQVIADPDFEKSHRIIVKWADLESSGKLFKMKETSLEGEFLSEVFGQALGYALFSKNAPQWHVQAKFAVAGGQADAAIGTFSAQEQGIPRALIELKGPRVNLDRHRDRGRTPVQQCWDYLNAVPGCPWGIVCNYVSFRLIERGLGLLKPDGRMGFIAPNVWLFNEYGRGLRELLAKDHRLERFVDFKSH